MFESMPFNPFQPLLWAVLPSAASTDTNTGGREGKKQTDKCTHHPPTVSPEAIALRFTMLPLPLTHPRPWLILHDSSVSYGFLLVWFGVGTNKQQSQGYFHFVGTCVGGEESLFVLDLRTLSWELFEEETHSTCSLTLNQKAELTMYAFAWVLSRSNSVPRT